MKLFQTHAHGNVSVLDYVDMFILCYVTEKSLSQRHYVKSAYPAAGYATAIAMSTRRQSRLVQRWGHRLYTYKDIEYHINKVVPFLNQVPRNEDVWRSGGIASRVFNVGSRWK
jgi:hypothetical protein